MAKYVAPVSHLSTEELDYLLTYSEPEDRCEEEVLFGGACTDHHEKQQVYPYPYSYFLDNPLNSFVLF